MIKFLKTKILIPFFINVGIFALAVFISQFSTFQSINNLLTDQLQGSNIAREEIVIIGIDDQSLQEIGAWPWSRDIFATAIENLEAANPSVVGIDVLFLEPRDGDTEFSNAIDSSTFPIILGSKLLYSADQTEAVLSSGLNSKSGYVNFEQDPDGKIRRVQAYEFIDGKCNLSLSLALAKDYFRIADSEDLCSQTIQLRNNAFETNSETELRLNYTEQDFAYISFLDIYTGNFESGDVKDKILILGSTVKDLRTNLEDNFTGIFGETIPGVEIHANAINSYLNNSFLEEISTSTYFLFIFSLSSLLAFLYIFVNRKIWDFIIFIISIVLVNFGGLLLFEIKIIFPFVSANLILITSYFAILFYKFYTQRNQIKFVRDAFGKYMNSKLLKKLEDNPGLLQLGGESRKMTVLFSDIRSFTTISEGMSSQQLVQMINDYLNFMSGIIISYNGTIDKYIGDAIMAFWNAPLEDRNHQTNSVISALAMSESIESFNKHHKKYPDLSIGIGINTGEMTVGNIGGIDKFDYTVLGDNVNLASRLEGLTKYYSTKIIVSESTKKEVKHSNIIFRKLDDVLVKGKSQAVKIYEPMVKNAKNLELRKVYNKGFKLYQQGDFAKAILELENTCEVDPPAEMLIQRIENLTPEEKQNWDGIWKWDSK